MAKGTFAKAMPHVSTPDLYYVYRPLLDLIGFTEGTDKRDGYNETLGYGAYTGGDVELVKMSLKEIDDLQGKMLAHPKNKLNSSALGRYQIVRTTLRTIKRTLQLSNNLLFNEALQDRCACYLLGVRGIDKYLSGRLKEDTLINNLAQEWASLPTTKDVGYYGGQRAAVKSARVREVLAEVRKRHDQAQPKEIVAVEVDKPVVPPTVEKEVKKKFSLAGWIGSILSGGGIGALGLAGFGWRELLVMGGLAIVVLLGGLALRGWIVKAIKDIKAELEAS
ncbi:hypothetical protein R5W60_04655 [Brucella pseudintermedia]|uniref:hypothetical protein n=1 Tax=Brucella pseudintermedia TaxID=370111 RepID=UPI003670AFA5|nr:hypothetical protein R5W60_04655 [Brucella pseudintermedia]